LVDLALARRAQVGLRALDLELDAPVACDVVAHVAAEDVVHAGALAGIDLHVAREVAIEREVHARVEGEVQASRVVVLRRLLARVGGGVIIGPRRASECESQHRRTGKASPATLTRHLAPPSPQRRPDAPFPGRSPPRRPATCATYYESLRPQSARALHCA